MNWKRTSGPSSKTEASVPLHNNPGPSPPAPHPPRTTPTTLHLAQPPQSSRPRHQFVQNLLVALGPFTAVCFGWSLKAHIAWWLGQPRLCAPPKKCAAVSRVGSREATEILRTTVMAQRPGIRVEHGDAPGGEKEKRGWHELQETRGLCHADVAGQPAT